MIGAAFECEHVVVVVRAERDRARQHGDLGRRRQCRGGVGDPVERRPVVDRLAPARQQRSTGLGVLVDQDHARVRRGGREGGGQSGRAGPDHEHVCMRIALVVDGVIGSRIQGADPRDGGGGQSVDQFPGRGGHRRLGAGAADLQQRVGLLAPGGHDAAGTTVVDRVADPDAPVGQQRRGHGVARVPGVGDVVDGEGQHGVAVDPATAG
jgi:hypothetical protein